MFLIVVAAAAVAFDLTTRLKYLFVAVIVIVINFCAAWVSWRVNKFNRVQGQEEDFENASNADE